MPLMLVMFIEFIGPRRWRHISGISYSIIYPAVYIYGCLNVSSECQLIRPLLSDAGWLPPHPPSFGPEFQVVCEVKSAVYIWSIITPDLHARFCTPTIIIPWSLWICLKLVLNTIRIIQIHLFANALPHHETFTHTQNNLMCTQLFYCRGNYVETQGSSCD